MAEPEESGDLRCPVCGTLPLPDNPHRDEKLVNHLYNHHRFSQAEVADTLGCSCTTVRTWMKKLDIESRDAGGRSSQRIMIDTEEVPCPICESPPLPEDPFRSKRMMSHLYDDHFLTIKEVSDRLDCSKSTVRRWLNRFDIEIRHGSTQYRIPKDELRKMHVEQQLSPNEIADHYGCTHTAIRNQLDKYGIEIRDYSGASEIIIETDQVPCPICESPPLPERPYRSEDILDHLYNDHDMIQKEIAETFDVSRSTINNWFSELEIEGTRYDYEIPEEELRKLYCDEKRGIEDIADYYGCSYLAVRNRLQNYGIEIRSFFETLVDADDTSYRDEGWLRHQYNEKEKSRQVIADECGVSPSTIQHWMNKFDIDARSLSNAQKQRALRRDAEYMDKDRLRELYWDEELTQRQIADEFGVTQIAIQRWMNRFGIELRYAGAHGQTYETNRGEYVRSSKERVIADWLYNNEIEYEYEPKPESVDLTPDFLIRGDFVEYWGMLSRKEYVDRMHMKLDRYESAGIEVVNIFPHDLENLNDKLNKYL